LPSNSSIAHPADKVALEPSGKSAAFRHHREDYTAGVETSSGLSHLSRIDCKSGFVLPKLVQRIFIKFEICLVRQATAYSVEHGTPGWHDPPYVAVYDSTDGAFYLQGFYEKPYNIPLGAGPRCNCVSHKVYSDSVDDPAESRMVSRVV
jgi:hypothetical protein